MSILEAAINLTPVFKIVLYVAGVGFALFVLFWVGFFILAALGSAFAFLSGEKDNEFGEIIVFWGGAAVIVVLIVLAFTQGIVAFN